MTADGREPVRIGLLGGGAVAQVAHLPAYRRLRTARLVAICEREAPKRRALRERAGVEHAVAEIDQLLAIDEVDAVDICLPSDLHRDAVVRCLEAGKHVLCEKPLGLTSDEVSDVIAASGSQALNYFIAQKYTDAIGQFATSPNAKTILFPVEATQLIGTVGGIGELVKDALADKRG